MSIWKDARGPARALALAMGLAGPPFAAIGGQPEGDLAIAAGPAHERVDEIRAFVPSPPAWSPGAALPSQDEPFDLPASSSPAPYAEKWRLVVGAITREEGVLARCRSESDACPGGALRFLAIVEAGRTKEGRARLGEINRAINLAIRYRSDIVRHGTPDAWMSPLATFASGEGDCEDYAIAKYVALREAGVRAADLRLVLVRDTRLRQDHAVVAARLDGRWLVLDNRRMLLVENRDIQNYVAIAGFGPDSDPIHVAADGAQGRPDSAQAKATANPS